MKAYIVSLVFAMFLITGCSFKAGYDPSYVQNLKTNFSQSKNTSVKVAVLTTTEQDNKIINQSPTSLTGGGTTLEIPVGIITRELTYEYFSQYYSDVSRIKTLNGEYSIVISPEITHFEYEYDQLSNLGFAITPKLSFNLSVQVYKDHDQVMNKVYESGVKNASSYLVSGQPGERINKLLHESLFQLLGQVKNDIDSVMAQNK